MDRTWGMNGLFSTGRITTVAVLLLVGGIALPGLKDGQITRWFGGEVGAAEQEADRGPISGGMNAIATRAKIVATRARMRGIVKELNLWTDRHGLPDSGDLTDAVGTETATDSWGHRIRFIAPTEDTSGGLRSFGPDGKRSQDDLILSVSYKDLTGAP